MHVALLQEYFVPHAPGGAEWSTLALARQLTRRGAQVTIITTDLAGDDTRDETARVDRDLAAAGICVVRLPFPKKMRGAPQTFASYVFGNALTERRFARQILDCGVRPDLYHAQSLGTLVPAWRAARQSGVPVLATIRDYRGLCPAALCLHRDDFPPRACSHADYRRCVEDYRQVYDPQMQLGRRVRYRLRRELEWMTRGRQQRALREIDATVFVSDAARMIYATADLAGRRPVVIHNQPPEVEEATDAAELRARFHLNGPLLLFVGRWSLGKGADELSRAWPLIRAAHPQAQLVVVGRREADVAPQPADGAIFTGPLSHADTLGLIAAAHAVLLPSRWPEPYSRVALEAMAAGKPLVATKAGGNPELVRDDVTGYVVPRHDPAAFAAQVSKLLTRPDLARKMGEAGRRRLREDLSGERQLDALLALYERLRPLKDERLRICAPATSLSEQTDLGGGYFHVKNLQGLADRDVHCLIPLVFRPEHEPRANWDVRVLPLRRAFKLGPLLPNIAFFLAILWLRWVRGERFALVRIGDLYHFGPGALLAARLLGLPTVGMIHHVDDNRPRENAVVGWTARRLDGITVPSRATAAHVARRFGVDEGRLHLITEGASRFAGAPATAAEAKQIFGLADAPVIGFVGRLEARKNVGLLIEAFARVSGEHPRARLLIIGDGPQRESLGARTRELNVADSVIFAGRVDGARKAAALRAMDVFVFPSLMEGFGLAVAEAMIAGAPVVVSDRGSLPEIVRDGETGLVVNIESPQPLAEALDRLLRDEPLRARLADAGQRDAAARFTWEACAEQTEAAYRRVLAAQANCRLGVLLNSGDSLATMRREGQESRFVGEYLRRYAEAFDEVEVFSYGDDRERPLPNAVFVPGRPAWKGPLYAALMPLLHARRFRRLALLRVMQTGAALPAVLARLLYGVRFVTTYGYRYGDFMRMRGRRWYGRYLDVLDRVALRLADRVIVTTPSLRDHVRRMVGDEKIVLLPNGVDLSTFQPTPRAPRKGKATALFVGRLTAQKNLALALEALAPLRDRVRLVCAGEGELAEALRAQARALDVELELLGVVAHELVPRLHAEADLFVLPSRIEGHPKALLEAMASGLPCVGARAPGIVDVIVDGENGLLAEPDAASLRAAVERILDDPALAARLGENARRTAVEKYDLGQLLAREVELLKTRARGSRRCRAC